MSWLKYCNEYNLIKCNDIIKWVVSTVYLFSLISKTCCRLIRTSLHVQEVLVVNN